MINPAHFILASDFDAIGNDRDYSALISISGTVAGSDAGVFSTTIDTVAEWPAFQAYAASSLASGDEYLVTQYVTLARTGTTPTLGASPYNIQPVVYNSDSNKLEVQVLVVNPYSETLTLQSETITFRIKGFVPPYATPAETGTRATGTISIENRDWPVPAGVTLPKYTTFAAGDLHYVLTQSVALPGFTGLSSSPIPGIATCPATAVESGAEYNIANGTYMQIRGLYSQVVAPNDWRAYASGNFTGGS